MLFDRPAGRVVLGAGVVSLPAVAHGDAVATLFAALAPVKAAGTLAAVLGWVGLGSLVLLPALLWRTGRAAPGARAEIVAVLAMALALPPLAYFALYFGALHAPRHLIETAARLGTTPRRAASRSLRLTMLTLAAMAVAGAVLLDRGLHPGEASLAVIFTTLATLTVPHMALTAMMHRRGQTGAPARPGAV